MAFFESLGVDTANSRAIFLTPQTRVADPFDPANLTMVSMGTTSEDWAGYYVICGHHATGQAGVLLVTTGAVSSEVFQACLPLHFAYRLASQTTYVPIPVASGTHLSVGASVAAGPSELQVQIIGIPSTNFDNEPSFTILESGPFHLENDSSLYGKAFTYGPNATANTMNAYGEISGATTNYANNLIKGASLDEAYDYLGFSMVEFSTGQQNHRALATIAYGAISSETEILTEALSARTSAEINTSTTILWTPWGRASGDRLSFKHQCSITDAIDGTMGIFVYGIR